MNADSINSNFRQELALSKAMNNSGFLIFRKGASWISWTLKDFLNRHWKNLNKSCSNMFYQSFLVRKWWTFMLVLTFTTIYAMFIGVNLLKRDTPQFSASCMTLSNMLMSPCPCFVARTSMSCCLGVSVWIWNTEKSLNLCSFVTRTSDYLCP